MKLFTPARLVSPLVAATLCFSSNKFPSTSEALLATSVWASSPRAKRSRLLFARPSLSPGGTPLNDNGPSSSQRAKDGRRFLFSSVGVISGPFTTEGFASSQSWGRLPLLIRGGFDANNLKREESWPTWEEVACLGCDEDAESRLITHRRDDPKSWQLQLGPFEDEDIRELLVEGMEGQSADRNGNDLEDQKWTLVVNDVDRFYAPLAEWIDETYAFIPRWRRDDGQISLTGFGGGIGPHVDNYDVFLIQMAGERKWQVGKRLLSVEEEYDSLVDGIDVRILGNWQDTISTGDVEDLILKPGDVLYLPPRVVHCGTALSDHCMTLSVGCRAPSANDLVSRLAEEMTNSVSGCAVKRYTDMNLFENVQSSSDSLSMGASAFNSGEITYQAKEKARRLVKDAVAELIDNESAWDEIFGRFVTESKRARLDYPIPLVGYDEVDEDDLEWRRDLGIWGDPKLAVQSVLQGRGALYQAEGITFGHSLAPSKSDALASEANRGSEELQHQHRLFVNGKMYNITANGLTATIVSMISNKRRISQGDVLSRVSGASLLPDEIISLLEDLVEKGYLYGSDE